MWTDLCVGWALLSLTQPSMGKTLQFAEKLLLLLVDGRLPGCMLTAGPWACWKCPWQLCRCAEQQTAQMEGREEVCKQFTHYTRTSCRLTRGHLFSKTEVCIEYTQVIIRISLNPAFQSLCRPCEHIPLASLSTNMCMAGTEMATSIYSCLTEVRTQGCWRTTSYWNHPR